MHRLLRLGALPLLVGCASEPGWIDDRFFVRVDEDADLYVHAVGDGSSNDFILFLHGGPGGGSSTYELAPSAPIIHENAVMIYLDQRSSGASEGRTRPADLSLEMMRDDVLVVMDVVEQLYFENRVGDPRLWLMGHSWGGLLGPAVLFETDASDRLAGWIEVSGAHDLPKVHADSKAMLLAEADAQLATDLDADTKERWKALRKVAEAADPVAKNIDDVLELNEAAAEAEGLIEAVDFVQPDLGHTMGWMLERPTSWATNQLAAWPVATALLEKEMSRSYSERYRELELPTLLVTGAWDFVVPPTLTTDVELRIAADHLEVVEMSESGHVPMFNEPEAYAQTILDFVGSAP